MQDEEGGLTMEWISVKDRLPEDYQRVLCLFESGTMEVSFRASVKGFCYEGFKQTGKVTHWIPLPLLCAAG